MMTKGLLGTTACAVVLTFSLSACGGGGGGFTPPPANTLTPTPTPSPTPTPTPTPTPPPPPPPTNFDTAEYQASNYAVEANAIAAYNAGASGKGVKIGIVDSGINPNLTEFTGRIDPASGDAAGAGRGVSDEGGHGTAVSAVAAAARNNQNTMGVAWDATIVSERADAPGSCASSGGCTFDDVPIANGIDLARNAGARVINLSLGGSAPSATLLSAMQRAVDAGIVIVIAAGNDSTPDPDPFAATPASEFPGSVIIAGSIGTTTSNNTISTFSDRAGSSASSFLVALGFHDRAPDNTGAQFIWDGTSFAAPTISGAVALMAQAFPNLTGKQIVQILFNTADDLGAAGIDSVYGNGELDLARAFAPQGQTTMADSKTPVTGSNGDASPVMGDAFAKHSLGAVILDGYDRAYVLNLAKTIRQAAVDHPLSRSLQNDVKVANTNAGPFSIAMTVNQRHDISSGYSVGAMSIGPNDLRRSQLLASSAVARLDKKTAVAFGFADGAKEMERRLTGVSAGSFLVANDITGNPGFMASRKGSIALRHQFGRFGVTLSGENGDVWQEVQTTATGSPYRWSSVAVDRTLGRNWLQVGMSRLQETQTLLGGRLGGVLGGGGSNTMFLDAQARHDFGSGWTGSLTARHGWTDFSSGKFQTGAYSFDVAKQGLVGRNDTLAFRIAQPLRVEHGGFGMMLPTSYDYVTGTAVDTMETMSLRPSGREVDGELSYGSTFLDGNAWLGTNLFYRRDPGHIANSPDDLGGAVRFSLSF